MLKYAIHLICLSMLVFVLFSCVNVKSAIYFNDIRDSTIIVEAASLEPTIQKNDLLSISISSMNPEATQVFNVPNSTSQAAGYLVNQDGYIQFPLLGSIQAQGKSKKELKEIIAQSLVDKKLLLDPIVDVRYLNFKVTILGEVGSPTVVTVPSEKISLLEAIGLAGDLTIDAKRGNVLVIREEAGKRTTKRLNLNSTELLTSPYYFLRSNDIVYVEPSKTKIAGRSRFNQLYPIVLSTLSFAFLVFDRITR